MIGQNNAGKTTVIEAFRILGLATARLATLSTYTTRPEWLSEDLPLSVKGIKISAKVVDTDLEQVFHRYGNPPATIEAFFSNSVIIKIIIQSETDLFVTFSHNGQYVSGKKRVTDIGVPNLRVLPQIVPLLKDEVLVANDTLQRNKFSKRTSGNFRSNLFVSKNEKVYQDLQEMVTQTWGSLLISDISKDSDNTIYLSIRDSDFVTEIYYMGHGIQMWLQTLWFIVSSEANAIIILDEPDVFMHADMQRKLVRLLKGNYAQMIIATHSVEIISEVQPENILIINRKEDASLLADGYPVLQAAISGVGSVHNLSLSRLLNNKRYLFVEGKDMSILKVLYDKLFPKESEPLDHFPCVTTGGWSTWQAQKEQAIKLLNENSDLRIYFFYDRDYHMFCDIEEREKEAQSSNIRIHIWKRKELENYLLVNTAIARFICEKNKEMDFNTLCKEIQNMIYNECDKQKENIIEKIGDELSRKNRGAEPSQFFREVRKEIDNIWKTGFNAIVERIPGKHVFSQLSDLCKKLYNVSFNTQQIASHMIKSEIDKEISGYLNRIRESK
jgi:hypothetical protein